MTILYQVMENTVERKNPCRYMVALVLTPRVPASKPKNIVLLKEETPLPRTSAFCCCNEILDTLNSQFCF